jgi:uncharacterized protein DUF3618
MSARRGQAEIEQDIARTRERLAADYIALEQALAPRRLAGRGTRLLGRAVAAELERPSSPIAAVVLPLLLFAVGVVWLSLSRPPVEPRPARGIALPRLRAGL